jgi:hypothetical protein
MSRAMRLALAGAIALALCILDASAYPAHADSTSRITGRVTYEWTSGPEHVLMIGPVDDARVLVRSPLQTFETHTDRQGFFSLIGLIPVSQATIVVSHDGFLTRRGDFAICNGATLRLAVELVTHCSVGCFFYSHLSASQTDYQVQGSTYVVNPAPYETTTWQEQC